MLIVNRHLNSDVYQYLLLQGFDIFTSRIVAARSNNIDQAMQILNPTIRPIIQAKFNDMEKSALRIIKAIQQNQIIGIETDYDCDGICAHAIMYEFFTKIIGYPKSLIKSYIGERLKDGYGFNKRLAIKAFQDNVNLVITADNGSSCNQAISFLFEKGIDVIVTDHHSVNYPPKHAYSFLNPTYSDKYNDFSGCLVAWLLMLNVNKLLNNSNQKLGYLLDLVGLTVVSDCMPLISSYNRFIVKKSIEIINYKYRPCWEYFNINCFDVTSLQFYVAPMINACSRVADAKHALMFLLSKQKYNLKNLYNILNKNNTARKFIQKQVFEKAKLTFKDCIASSIIGYLSDSHTGINGLIAGQLVREHGKPCFIFSDSKDNKLSASGRSYNINIKNILDNINILNPNILQSYGGHAYAVGLSIKKTDLDIFTNLVNKLVDQSFKENNIIPSPSILIDGSVLDLTSIKDGYTLISNLEPFGQGFERPCFLDTFIIKSYAFINNSHTSMSLISKKGEKIRSIIFNNIFKPSKKEYKLIYEISGINQIIVRSIN